MGLLKDMQNREACSKFGTNTECDLECCREAGEKSVASRILLKDQCGAGN